jgi:hypothetical protein
MEDLVHDGVAVRAVDDAADGGTHRLEVLDVAALERGAIAVVERRQRGVERRRVRGRLVHHVRRRNERRGRTGRNGTPERVALDSHSEMSD